MIPLEQLADGSITDRNFQALQRLVLDTGGVTASIRFGTGTLTWPGGSQFTDTLTLPHGLPRTPVAAFATAQLAPATEPCVVHYVTVDATNVQWRGIEPSGTSPAATTAKPFFWLVIG